MRAQTTLKRKAKLGVKPLRAQIFARSIKPKAGCGTFAKGVVDQALHKPRPRTAAGFGKGKPAQFHPPRRVTDFAKKRKAKRLRVLPDQKPRGGVGKIAGKRGLVLISDKGRVVRTQGLRPDKGEISRRCWPKPHPTARAKAER